MMCQAPGASLCPPYRVHGQIRAVATPCGMSNAKRCWREPLLIAPKVPFRNTDLEKECPLRPSVDSRPIRSSLTPCTGWTPSTSSEALPFAQEVRKTRGDSASSMWEQYLKKSRHPLPKIQ